ncbi:unnamed protein product, partial [Mesorhabditis belari]|uniref:Uncharacterized protein n=1 Tax=Mesorhabditis belari TaxID=2138241 RepID=A0AAF3EFF2_9BILA
MMLISLRWTTMISIIGIIEAEVPKIDSLVSELGRVFRSQSAQAIAAQFSREFSRDKDDSKPIRWSKIMQIGGNLAESPKYALLSMLPMIDSSKTRSGGGDSRSNFNVNALKAFQSFLAYSATTTPKPSVSFKRILENTMGASPLSRLAGNLLDTVSSRKLGYEYERPAEMLFKKTWYGEALGTILGESPVRGGENMEIRRAPINNQSRNFGLASLLRPSPFATPQAPNFISSTTEVPPLVNPLELFSQPLQNFIGIQKRDKRVLETGQEAFDRLVIHENEGGGLLSNQWNKKGLQWTDGNLRLVNMKGRDLLGSEVAVHDHSIDIPIQSWIDLASGLLTTE